jgi:hypothetical protein
VASFFFDNASFRCSVNGTRLAFGFAFRFFFKEALGRDLAFVLDAPFAFFLDEVF